MHGEFREGEKCNHLARLYWYQQQQQEYCHRRYDMQCSSCLFRFLTRFMMVSALTVSIQQNLRVLPVNARSKQENAISMHSILPAGSFDGTTQTGPPPGGWSSCRRRRRRRPGRWRRRRAMAGQCHPTNPVPAWHFVCWTSTRSLKNDPSHNVHVYICTCTVK